MNNLVKLLLSAIILYSVFLTYQNSSVNSELNEIITAIGSLGLISILLIFFIAVAFYCKTLETCFSLIHPENRKAHPKSVWFMFLLPFNFVEDFFILINLSNSIENEAQSNEKLAHLKDFGMTTGIAWCVAQILSFIPNLAGQTAGVIGIVFWIIHWRFILKVNKLLIIK